VLLHQFLERIMQDRHVIETLSLQGVISQFPEVQMLLHVQKCQTGVQLQLKVADIDTFRQTVVNQHKLVPKISSLPYLKLPPKNLPRIVPLYN
jgi:hypothetical protein